MRSFGTRGKERIAVHCTVRGPKEVSLRVKLPYIKSGFRMPLEYVQILKIVNVYGHI